MRKPWAKVIPLWRMWLSMLWNSTVGGRGKCGNRATIWRSIAWTMASDTIVSGVPRPVGVDVEEAKIFAIHFWLLGLLLAGSALTVLGDVRACPTSEESAPTGIAAVGLVMEKDELARAGLFLTPLCLFDNGRCRCSVSSKGLARCPTCGPEPEEVACGACAAITADSWGNNLRPTPAVGMPACGYRARPQQMRRPALVPQGMLHNSIKKQLRMEHPRRAKQGKSVSLRPKSPTYSSERLNPLGVIPHTSGLVMYHEMRLLT